MRERAIIHLNIADFAARVETRLTPGLAGFPLIIAPEGAPRARVFDMSDQAFREGVRKGMPLARALRLHPRIPVLPPRFERYGRIMRDIFRQAQAFSPLIEAGEADGHLFLDITGTSRLHGPPPDVAWRLRRTLRKAFGLDPIWTLATNRLVAKAASRIVKPLGEYIVGPGEEEAFLATLPIGLLPGLTGPERRTLARFNIVSVSQAKALSPAQLAVPFEARAGRIHSLFRGIDDSPFRKAGASSRDILGNLRDISAGHEFGDDTNEPDQVKAVLTLLTARVCRNLVRERRQVEAVGITLTYSDGVTRSTTRKTAADNELTLLPKAWAQLLSAWTRRTRIRHLNLSIRTCPRVPVQAPLFPGPQEDRKPETGPAKLSQVAQALDKIRTRFGTLAVHSGTVLNLGTAARSGQTA